MRISLASAAVVKSAHEVWLPFGWKKRRYALRPTRYGLFFLAMLAALLIGSINHNNNFGYLLTFLLGGMVLVSLFHTFANLTGISLHPMACRPVFAGDTASFSFFLHATADKIAIAGRIGQVTSAPVDCITGAAASITIPVPTTRRGMLTIQSITLVTSFPLSLLEMRTTVPVTSQCLVYPRPLRSQLVATGHGDPDGDESPVPSAGETEFDELSPYRVGDDIRRAHWKSLAAGKELHTIRFEQTLTGGTMFSLALTPGEDIETKLRRLSYMIVTAESRALEYGLILDELTIGAGKGTAHREACLKALALY
jgi:uncharacterized protein (DUF58 family)